MDVCNHLPLVIFALLSHVRVRLCITRWNRSNLRKAEHLEFLEILIPVTC